MNTILSPSRVVGAVRWDMEQEMQETHQDHTAPDGCSAAFTHSSPPLVTHCCQLRHWTPSEGNKTILTIVDRFSKAVHFVPLPKLPSALETANLLVQHVFHLHGIPQDIVSD